jgi:1-deoxy-D-xylulose-5-phosphate reductoisomerase
VIGVAILGSTGSIGEQALDVVAAAPGRFRVVALAAQRSAAKLAEQARRFRPEAVALAEPEQAVRLRGELPAGVRLQAGPEAVAALATADGVDVVLNAVSGSVGLAPTLAALDAGRRLALANKESLIVGGELVTGRAKPGQIVPVDSEHSGLAQCLRAGGEAEVSRLVLTASGGPFRGWPRERLADVTAAQALAHPTWSMGPVITVNSATLMNKGLEVIEAHLLFGIPFERIDVVVHPQSVVHALVEFCDGSTIAQLSLPDMRLPIGLALGWPDRSSRALGRIDWSRPAALEFEPVDHGAFPMLGLAVRAGRRGGIAPAVLNAANEEAVAAFLDGRLPFGAIVEVVAEVLTGLAPPGTGPAAREGTRPSAPPDLAAVLASERSSRARARTLIQEQSRYPTMRHAGRRARE